MSGNTTDPKQWQDALPFFHSSLFAAVQEAGIFCDSKTFADATPRTCLTDILKAYANQSVSADFNLKAFAEQHFFIPVQPNVRLDTQKPASVNEYITHIWRTLTKPADSGADFSLIPLPYPYIVPGGRFREIYYWDTYFSALGLMHSGNAPLVIDLIQNFLHLQQEVGCIPNGNRAYYHSRSQPPVLALMSEFISPDDKLMKVAMLDGLQREYQFWMQRNTGATSPASLRSVAMANGYSLNRYYDSSPLPRPESHREDRHLAASLPVNQRSDFYRHIRAACESGWDFSSRWLADNNRLETIRTCEILPVDLNCLLYKLESTLAQQPDDEHSSTFQLAANKRAEAIQLYFWNEQQQFFTDYHFPTQKHMSTLSLAGMMPLFVGLATTEQASLTALKIEKEFLHKGGLITTLNTSSQQWDAPNGWAPLQWFAVKGLQQYGYTELARTIMLRFMQMVEHHYQQHGVILEKYNVADPAVGVGGGEYEVQLGFGWTNGVYQDFRNMLGD